MRLFPFLIKILIIFAYSLLTLISFDKMNIRKALLIAAVAVSNVAVAQDGISKSYFDKNETQLMSEGNLKDGHENGRWTYYYRNGKKYKEVDFYMGIVNGRVAYYYENGTLMNEGMVVNNQTVGPYKEYFNDGTLKTEGQYRNGDKDSIWNHYNIVSRLVMVEHCQNGVCKVMEAWDNAGTKLVDSGNGIYKEYLSDEKTLKEEGRYKNGLKDSTWVTYWNNGNKLTVMNFKEGQPTGEVLTFYESGKKRSIENIENGEYKLWYENGNLSTSGYMKDSERDSVWKYFSQDGILMREGSYLKGKKQGLHTAYFPSGKKESEIQYRNGLKEGHAVWYRRDTTSQQKNRMVKHMEGDFAADIQTGHWTYYQIDGKVGNEGEYENGKMAGLWTWYYDTGEVWKKGTYKNGERNGVYTVFFENGKIFYTGNFKDNKEEGFWKRFHESGRPEMEGCFHNGMMDSIWKEWFPNGVLRYEISYKSNMKDGLVVYYDETGMKTMINTYRNGKYNGKFIQYNETGVAVVDGQYIDDKKTGEWIYRQADSKIVRKENYNDGRPSGTWTEYYPNGNIQTRKSYSKTGVIDGRMIKYDRYGKVTYEAQYSNGKLVRIIQQAGGTNMPNY